MSKKLALVCSTHLELFPFIFCIFLTAAILRHSNKQRTENSCLFRLLLRAPTTAGGGIRRRSRCNVSLAGLVLVLRLEGNQRVNVRLNRGLVGLGLFQLADLVALPWGSKGRTNKNKSSSSVQRRQRKDWTLRDRAGSIRSIDERWSDSVQPSV